MAVVKIQRCLRTSLQIQTQRSISLIHITVRVRRCLFMCWFAQLCFKLSFEAQHFFHIFPPFPFRLVCTFTRLFIFLHQLGPLQTPFVCHDPRIKTGWIKTIVAFKIGKHGGARDKLFGFENANITPSGQDLWPYLPQLLFEFVHITPRNKIDTPCVCFYHAVYDLTLPLICTR